MDILKQLYEKYACFVNDTGSSSEVGTSDSHFQSSQSEYYFQCETSDVMDIERNIGYEKMSKLYEKLVVEIGSQDSSNELEMYLKENVENPKLMRGVEFDVLSWWKRNALKYPVISLIARDIFAMQVSSVASESAFSTSGRILDPSRSCLTHYMIEVLMCLEQWMKNESYINDEGILITQQMQSDIQFQDELLLGFAELNITGNEGRRG